MGELAKLAKQWDTVGQASKIWDQLPLRRGMLAEQELGRSARLVQNFPVIDKFENGVATSIKTLDWRASTYQDPARLESKVRGYIDKLANWQGASWGKETIQAADIRQRELLLGLPPGFSEEQGAIFDRLIEYGRNNGVDVRIAIITE